MPTTINFKDSLARLAHSVDVMRAWSKTGGGVPVAASAFDRTVKEAKAALSASVHLAVRTTTHALPRALSWRWLPRASEHVSMNRRALLVCVALGAWCEAGAQTLGSDNPDVQTLIEALRPLPGTRGFEKPKAVASAALNVEFEPGSVRLTEQGRRDLDALGTALGSGELETYDFRIEVYVDANGNASREQLLSKRQANAIKDYLVKQYQLSPGRLTTDGRGSANPTSKRPRGGSPLARRVVVVNTSSVQ